MISIRHNYFGITFIHTLNQPKVSSKKFIYFQFSSKFSFMFHIYPNISSFWNQFHPYISTYQMVHPNYSSTCNYHPKSSLMFNFHLNFSSIFYFHPCTCGKIFSTSFLHGIEIFFKKIIHVIRIFQKYPFLFTCSCSQTHAHVLTS